MDTREQHLIRLLSLTTRSLTHLSAAMTEMSFELMRSEDEAARQAGRRMIDHLAAISAGLDEHWQALGDFGGGPPEEPVETLVEVELQPVDEGGSG